MITSIQVSKARLKFGELTTKVFNKENIFILKKSGLPIAAVINMEEFNKLDIAKEEHLNKKKYDTKTKQNNQSPRRIKNR